MILAKNARFFYASPKLIFCGICITKSKSRPDARAALAFVGGEITRSSRREGLADIPVHRAVGGAGAVVLAFLVHAEGVPCRRTEDLFLRDVVHAHRNPEHGAEGDQVGAHDVIQKEAATPIK